MITEIERILMKHPLPRYFCWTKFGVEAGESIESILLRKELERVANGGVFLWGIGNALAPSILALLEKCPNPEVIFSPIRSKPQKKDVLPPKVVTWKLGETMDGEVYDLPKASVVTSRGSDRNRSHYALVCKTNKKLTPDLKGEKINYSQLTNLRTGNALGYSQVTSVVSNDEKVYTEGAEYIAAIRAQLVYPYFIKLCEPSTIKMPTRAKNEAQQGLLHLA